MLHLLNVSGADVDEVWASVNSSSVNLGVTHVNFGVTEVNFGLAHSCKCGDYPC